MPLYQYECEKCGEQFDVRQKFVDAPLTIHEECGGSVHRMLSAPALQFKGSGFYITDYAKNSTSQPGNGGNKKDGSGEKSGSDSSGSEKSANDKSSGDKSSGEKSGADKSGGDKSGGNKSSGDKSESSSQSSSSTKSESSHATKPASSSDTK